MPEIFERVAAYIERYQLLPASGEIIVAVSGGADSLCLLHLLHRLCGPGPGKLYSGVRLHVAHLNHKLRGETGSRDAAYVAQLATDWGLPVTLGEIDVPMLASQERRSLEDAARTARYRFLREVAQGQLIAVAHQSDDQVETLLLHLLRGEGLYGMAGMLPRQQDIIRPLLEVSHAETVAYCQQHHLVPLEDASNIDPRFLRNRIRHELLPLLESMNPGIRATLLRNAEVIRTDITWIDARVDSCWPAVVIAESPECITLSIDELNKLPLALQRHLLHRVAARLCEGQPPLELRHYLLIEQLVQRPPGREEQELDLPAHLRVRRNLNVLVVERLLQKEPLPIFSAWDTEILLPVPGEAEVTGTPWLASAEFVTGEIAGQARQALEHGDWTTVWRLLPATRHTVYIDGDSIGSYLRVRTRRSGDRIQPLGMVGEKKVQDVLVDKHIPRAERPYIPLFFSGSRCIWLAGVCIDERVKLTGKTQKIIRLSIQHII